MEQNTPKKPRIRKRYYSFKEGKKLNWDNMQTINDVKIPSQQGSIYYGIICALATHKHKFCPWWVIVELAEKFICQNESGKKQWERFVQKSGVKTYQDRIKENTYTLTRKDKNCYGYRLHELGMGVYYFRDGAMLLTGGKYIEKEDGYNVEFPDGRELQYKYNGTNFTSREYKDFVKIGLISRSCRIINQERLAFHRLTIPVKLDSLVISDISAPTLIVTVELDESYNQDTAARFESLGFVIDEAKDNKLTGRIPAENIMRLRQDSDIKTVEVSER